MGNQEKFHGEFVDLSDSDTDNYNYNHNDHEDIGMGTGEAAKCHVCGMAATTRHFGGFACRACAAFFRRSVVLNKEFNCRCSLKTFMNGILESEFCGKMFCRACRFKRCLEIGMRTEAVRAATFRRFHEERRINLGIEDSNGDQQQEGKPKIINLLPIPNLVIPDQRFHLRCINQLLPLESRMKRISFSLTNLPPEYYHKFETLETLIDNKENILDHYNRFSEQRPAGCWDRMKSVKILEETGFWQGSKRLCQFFQNLMLSADMIKTIPVFSKLELEDQKTVLKDSVRKCTQFFMAYFSLNVNNEAIVWADGTNIFEIYSAIGRHYNSDLIINAAYKVFVSPMTEMNRVRPSKEEFVLLLAMLVSNPASPGLSDTAKVLLNAEAEKYGRVLMHYEQNRLGQSAGVLRYMELQSLLWNAITSTHKVRQIYAYCDTVLDQGCFSNTLPPILRQFTVEGSNI